MNLLSDAVPYEQLDHSQLAETYRQCVGELRRNGGGGRVKTYRAIATQIANGVRDKISDTSIVNEESLRKFCAEKKTARINANNKLLKILHYYFVKNPHRHNTAVRALLIDRESWDAAHGKAVDNQNGADQMSIESTRLAWVAMTAWFQVSETEISRTISKIRGDYVVIRRSMADATSILKSRLSIGWDPRRKIIEVTHEHRDRYGGTRTTTGMLIPLRNSTAALILEVEDAEAMEFILLRIPINRAFERIMGFIISVNVERQPVSSRLFFERTDPEWEALDWRFDLDALTSMPRKKAAVEAYLEHTKASTLPDHGPILTDKASEPRSGGTS